MEARMPAATRILARIRPAAAATRQYLAAQAAATHTSNRTATFYLITAKRLIRLVMLRYRY